MLNFLPGPVKGMLSFLFYLINTMVMCTIIFMVALVKFTVRLPSCRVVCDKWLIAIATA